MVVQLRDVIGTPAKAHADGLISGFSCIDKDVENFLKTKAYQHEQRNKSRTYLVIANDTYKLIAYFTLSLKALELDDGISKTVRKNVDGFNKAATSVPVILIGQLGKDSHCSQEIRGSDLLDSCLSYVYKTHSLVGSRVVLVETAKSEKVIAFYDNNGFTVFREDPNDKLVQMIRTL